MMKKALYRELADVYRNAIQAGTFLHGHQLPSLRQLVQQHKLSLSTVLQTLRLLEQEGWVEARDRTGYFVNRIVRSSLSPVDEPNIYAERQHNPYDGIHERISQFIIQRQSFNPTTDFSGMGASAEFYPVEALKTIAAKLLRQQPQLLAEVRLGQAYMPYCKALTKHARTLGMQLSATDIVATHGAKDAVSLALQAVTNKGDKVAVESPTYFGLLQTIESLGLQAIEIPTSPTTGISIEALEQTLYANSDIKALVVVPHLQNPLGSIMPNAHKQQLVQLCVSKQVVVIEDDVYGGLMRNPSPPIKSFDPTGQVIYCGSFNKTLAPGIRLGWLVGGRWHKRIEMLKFARGIGDNLWMQTIVAHYINSGGYDRHLRQFRINVAQQRRLMIIAIAEYFPIETKLNSTTDGMSLWLQLPENTDTVALLSKANNEGIGVCSGTVLSNTLMFEHCIRLSCGKIFNSEVDAALKRLGELCREFKQ